VKVRRRRPVLLALLVILIAGITRPLNAETHGDSADDVPTDARIERLREAIEREREALEDNRQTRRSMEAALGQAREELERTRQQVEELERAANPDAGGGD